MKPRIAITGLGTITRFGDLDATWRAVLAGSDGGVVLAGSTWEGLPSSRAAVVSNALLAETCDPRLKRLDRVARLALIAARRAWRDAGDSVREVPPPRRAVLIGTSRGCTESIEAAHLALWGINGATSGTVWRPDISRVSPFASPATMASSPAAAVSIEVGCRGPNLAVTATCASGAHAIGLAARIIQAGMADVALAGGAEASVTPFYVALAWRAGILTRTRCRPFDVRRDGTLLGEGAGIVILERWEQAAARGARIHAELLGYGASSDADSLYAPASDGHGLAQAMLEAIREANMDPRDVGFIKAHGTGTPKGDEAEALAIRTALGRMGAEVPVIAMKPVVGHTVGASAALESLLAIRALRECRLPPTANLEQVDGSLGLNLIAGASIVPAVPTAIVNSAGFGGTNGCLAIRLS